MPGPGCVVGAAWSLFVSRFCGCLCVASVGVFVVLLLGCRLSGRGPVSLGVVLSSVSRRIPVTKVPWRWWSLLGGYNKTKKEKKNNNIYIYIYVYIYNKKQKNGFPMKPEQNSFLCVSNRN